MERYHPRPFIVYTSNIFAILGLAALYFFGRWLPGHVSVI